EIDYNIFNLKGAFFMEHFPLYIEEEKYFDLLKEKLTASGMREQIKRNRHALLSLFSSPLDVELISKDPLNIREIFKDQSAQKGLGDFGSKGGYYISNDNSTLIMFVKPTGSSRDIAFVSVLKKEIDRIVDETLEAFGYPDGLHIHLSGVYALAAEAQKTMEKDILFSFISSAIIIILLFQFIYKTKPMVIVIVAATLFTALSWTLGTAYFLFGGLNLASSIVAVMLMGLGIDYVIHIFKKYEVEFLKKKNPLKALEVTFSHTGRGIITGGVTTILAFFSIVVTSFEGLHQLGIVAGLGVLSCLFAVLIFMTALMVWMGEKMPHLIFQESERGLGTNFAARKVSQYPRFFLRLGVVLFMVASIGITQITFDSSPEGMGMKNSPTMAVEKKIAEKFGSQKNPLIILKEGESDSDLMASFDAIENKLEVWKKEKMIESYSSLSLFIPPPFKQEKALEWLDTMRKSMQPEVNELKTTFFAALKENGFRVDAYSEKYINGIQNVLMLNKQTTLAELQEGFHRKVKNFYNHDKSEMATYIFPIEGTWKNEALEKIGEDISALGGDIFLLGPTILFKELKGSIIFESTFASSIAFLIVLSVLYFHFRSIKRVALVLFPLSIGLFYTIGLMGFLDISFNYINISAITLLFGIGVDYGIYILQGYLSEERLDLKQTIQQVGQSVLICALTTVVGFGSLVTMRFAGVASLGLVISFGVALCFFSAIFLLPSLLHFLEE
ncbi:MAG: RND family transporter, partial [Nitrospinota bacterium]